MRKLKQFTTLPILLLLVANLLCVAQSFQFVAFHAYGGNNNVRNAFYGALEVAWMAKIRFNMSVIIVAPNNFGGSSGDLLKVFDLVRLEAAGLKTIYFRDLTSDQATQVQRDWGNSRCRFTSDTPWVWLERIKAMLRDNVCLVGVDYEHRYEDSAGRFDDKWQNFNIREMYRAVQFRDSIQELGAALRNLLPESYVAVHYRAGDKSPMPLFNCSRYGFTRAGLRSRACTHKHDALRSIVSYEEVLLDLWRIKPPTTVFVATHPEDDVRFQLFRETLTLAGLKVRTLSDLKRKLEPRVRDQLHDKNKDVGFLSSWIDQYLCAQADQFLPAATSTWTQLVVIMRRELGKRDADEWVGLYSEAFRLYGADATHYQYYDGGEGSQIIPNFMTRCPAGTSVAGPYCLCNNAASECAILPRGPKIEKNKGCLPGRRFSPLTFRRVNGFHASCLACRCDPFDGLA
eukprot:m.243069 g.243069  ORF g.243069 m.243069 type:complete len:458 (-) comp26902_c0_seq1:37-1410(-)